MSAILPDAFLIVSLESTSVIPLSRLASASVTRSQRLAKTTVRLPAASKRLQSGRPKPRSPCMPVIIVCIKYHKASITSSFLFCCGRRGSWLDVMMSARLCTGTTFVLIVLISRKDVLLSGLSFWLAALRLIDQSQEILLGHSVFFY